ncbi:MAG TPA: enoyl-CoA hydratase-related protein [Tepidiformaceae bacterium]
MDYEQILFEQRGRVAIITLNRPEKLNAWTPTMMAEMRKAMTSASDSAGAIVITGSGRAFCAGADISAVFAKNVEAADSGGQRDDGEAAGASDWVSFLRTLPRPTIAAVNGTAVGIGVTQILPADIRIAGEDAKFGMFFVKMGLVPELASSALLPQMVGQARALEWCLTGRMISAAEARDAGLVSEVVPNERLLDRAVELGEQLAAQSSFAMTKIRQLLVDNTNETSVETAMRREGEALSAAYRSWEHKEAIDAFLGKRAPDFQKQPPTRVE